MKNEIENKISNIISPPTINSEIEAAYLMTLIRKRIEHMSQAEKSSYFVLNFYCTWTVHVKIDKSKLAMNILKEINQWVNDLKASNNPDLIKGLSEVIAFPRFRKELLVFLSTLNLPTNLASDDTKWNSFLRLVIDIIHACPLQFPEIKTGIIEQIYNAIKATPIKTGMWVESISIFNRDEISSITNNAPPDLSPYFLRILTSDTTSIIVPLQI
ncbi:MAG: hypothetical protein WC624_02785 [Candidatus Margulisiibacteriota bacterium]